MRILHVSDLHFGQHDELLADALKRKVKSLKPDLIVCTGDVADQPDETLLRQGLTHLHELAASPTPNAAAIPLIVVPGNHDYRVFGFLQRTFVHHGTRPYKAVFGGMKQEGFFETESGDVWVFGFNSSALGEFGGSGKIDPAEIEHFHKCYENMRNSNAKFANCFKIVAVHHHPLPVNRRQDFRARWLTMTNSGDFLSAVLFRRIDLVLHGHEHLQSQSEFSSTLGDNQHRIFTSSLGATLRKGRENWFGMITVERDEIKCDFYTNVGQEWKEKPVAPPWMIRSKTMSEVAAWRRQRKEAGYYYRELSSITVLDQDGDAQRAVECEDLRIERKDCERARLQRLRLPASSGSLQRLRAEGEEGLNITVRRESPAERGQPLNAVLEFHPPIHRSARYIYRWFAVNAFAMDSRQFDHQYSQDPNPTDNIEYTHYVVDDPIDELTVVAQFPPRFKFREGTHPRIRVMKYDASQTDSRKWAAEEGAMNALKEAHALHYYPSMNTAALRVKRPIGGLSYGIEWTLLQAGKSSELSEQELEIRAAVARLKNMSEATGEALVRMMGRIIDSVRAVFLRKSDGTLWPGPLGAAIMYFDGKYQLEVVIAAYQGNSGREIAGAQSDVKLRYGDGIAGRAFKANRPRVYVAPDPDLGDEEAPDYFVHFPEAPDYKVVFSLPLHVPSSSYSRERPRAYESQRPYGVLNLDSLDERCPLRRLRNPDEMPEVQQFQHEVNRLIFDELTKTLG